jgi:hypothetical protein
MIQSVLQSLTASPVPEPEESDYDISLNRATISQHVVSRRSHNSSPTRPPKMPKRSSQVSQKVVKGYGADNLSAERVEVVVDVEKAVGVLQTLEALVRQPNGEYEQNKKSYISSAKHLISAMKSDTLRNVQMSKSTIENKERGEVLIGIMVVSMKIIRLSIELGAPAMIRCKKLLTEILSNERLSQIFELLAEIVLVGLSMLLTILKMIQRWMEKD